MKRRDRAAPDFSLAPTSAQRLITLFSRSSRGPKRLSLGRWATSRAELAKQLLESLDNLSEAEIEKLWIEAAERRYEAYEAGQVKAVPADEVFARLRARKK